jgi:phosphoenolpyruvate carboxykinase (ATP)
MAGRHGVFNFEGGCYAKTINLSREAEPEIFATTERFGTVLENVVLDENRVPDFDDGSLTENTRCAYPLHFIPNASETGRRGPSAQHHHADGRCIRRDAADRQAEPEQAMYHFLSGYTAKVAGTEKGVTEPEATFSTCFGAPFMPRHPSEYGNLLRADRRAQCQLLAGQHRLDRRRLWRGPAHADQGDAGPAERCA